MQRDRNTLKGWFETGDFPTQQQFWDFIDSVLNLTDDAIAQAQIAGLVAALAGKADQAAITSLQNQINALGAAGVDTEIYTEDSSYAVADGKLLSFIVVIPTADINLSVGKTDGGGEYLNAVALPANVAMPLNVAIYAQGATTVYLNGITDSTTFKFYIK